MLAYTLSTCANIGYLQTAFLASLKFMKVCSTFHGFVLDLRKKVLENVLRECSQFCCGEDPIVAATNTYARMRAFAKNVYKPRQCHAKGVLLHEVGSVSTLETQILGGFYEGLCNAQDRRVRLD